MSDFIVKSEEYKGYQVKVVHDDNPQNPREWDNFGHMICFHRRYNLGDTHNLSVEEAQEITRRKDVIYLPLYLYDHSGLAMRTCEFWEDAGGWDSGCVGIIYVERDEVLMEYSAKRLTRTLIEKVKKLLQCEVSTYHAYLSGEVYGWVVEKDGEVLDSVWGFYGDYDYCLSDGKAYVDYLVATEERKGKEYQEQLSLSLGVSL